VPVGKPPALAQAVRAVIEDRGLATRLGAAGRRRVENEFRAATMVERFAALYEELAREKGLRSEGARLS
jgi:glycosyltransferase involved in cell wall biosynthesis